MNFRVKTKNTNTAHITQEWYFKIIYRPLYTYGNEVYAVDFTTLADAQDWYENTCNIYFIGLYDRTNTRILTDWTPGLPTSTIQFEIQRGRNIIDIRSNKTRLYHANIYKKMT